MIAVDGDGNLAPCDGCSRKLCECPPEASADLAAPSEPTDPARRTRWDAWRAIVDGDHETADPAAGWPW